MKLEDCVTVVGRTSDGDLLVRIPIWLEYLALPLFQKTIPKNIADTAARVIETAQLQKSK